VPAVLAGQPGGEEVGPARLQRDGAVEDDALPQEAFQVSMT
jgi:hypothetical protein